MAKNKILLVGGGQIGGNLALLAAQKELGDVVIYDIPQAEGMIKGKALDILQLRPHDGYDVSITGTSDPKCMKDSDVVIITAGIPRLPGMSRDDLLLTNMKIVTQVVTEIVSLSPDSILIPVTNPLDAMAYQAYKISGFPSNRVVGMAGILDTSRFRTFISQELKVSVSSISTYVLGGHGDTMVPLIGQTIVGGKPIAELIPADRLEQIVQRARDGGAEIVDYLKTGSAYYAPSASVVQMIESILFDKNEVLPCTAYLEGEYEASDVYAGVPVVLGQKGVERIVEFKLTEKEKALFGKSVDSVRELISIMGNS